MARADRDYWAKLRVDPRSQWSAGLAILVGLALTLSVIGLLVDGSQIESRGNPLYWFLMAPLVWWGSELMGFEARAVMIMPVVTWLAPLGSAICLAIAMGRGEQWNVWLISLVVCLCTSIASRIVFRGSLLQREGPSR